MSRPTIGRLPYWAIALILAVLTFGLIYLGFRLGFGLYTFAFLVVPVGLAVWYMAEYSATAESPAPSPAPIDPQGTAPAPETFEDPVIEADLYDSLQDTGPKPPPVEEAPPAR